MDYNTALYCTKYKCPKCRSIKIGFYVDTLDFTSLVILYTGNAVLLPLPDSDFAKYMIFLKRVLLDIWLPACDSRNDINYTLWNCKNCFEVGEFKRK